MSNHEMKKYRIKSCREIKNGLLLCSIDGDEWILKADNTLLHRDSRNKRGNVSFHRQHTVKSLLDCLDYIKWHTDKYIKPSKKMDRISYLFSII